MTCPRCHQTHDRCGAHRRDGGPCRQWPIDGHDKCRLHAGRKLAVIKAKIAAEQAVKTYGLPVDIDPHEALLEEVHRTAGHVRWLASIVSELDQGSLVWGVSEAIDKRSSEFPGRDVTHAAAPNVWLDLYHRERAHLVAVCKTAIAAGIDERRVQLAEQQGAAIVAVIRATLADLGVEVTPAVAQTVGRHLRAVS